MDFIYLQRLAREVDGRHRDAMRSLAHETTDAPTNARRGTSRRDVLRTGAALTLAGTAAAVGSAIATSAGAAGADTTTTVPARPTDTDVSTLQFAQSLELVAVAAYGTALSSKLLTDSAVVSVAQLFQGHHREHATALAAMISKLASGKPNSALLNQFGPQFSAAMDQAMLLELAFKLETAAASTYLAFLGSLQATEPAALVASILPIEADHAVVLGQALNLDLSAYAPSLETVDKALDPSAYANG